MRERVSVRHLLRDLRDHAPELIEAARGVPAALHALVAELGAWAARAPWHGRRAKTVYLGGGTPALFSPAFACSRFSAKGRWALSTRPRRRQLNGA